MGLQVQLEKDRLPGPAVAVGGAPCQLRAEAALDSWAHGPSNMAACFITARELESKTRRASLSSSSCGNISSPLRRESQGPLHSGREVTQGEPWMGAILGSCKGRGWPRSCPLRLGCGCRVIWSRDRRRQNRFWAPAAEGSPTFPGKYPTSCCQPPPPSATGTPVAFPATSKAAWGMGGTPLPCPPWYLLPRPLFRTVGKDYEESTIRLSNVLQFSWKWV